MNEQTILLPPGRLGGCHHYALDAVWARTTDLAFARTLCGRRALLTPAGWAEYHIDPSMFPTLCSRCAAKAARGETSADTAGDGRAVNGLVARPSGTQENDPCRP